MGLVRSIWPAALALAWGCAETAARTAQDPLAGAPGSGTPSTPSAPGASGGPDASPYPSAPTTIATTGDASTACMEYDVSTTTVIPEIFVVFDRSLSMVANGWAPAVSAIEAVTKEFDADIDFGLMVFPDAAGFTCTASTVDVPIKANNAGAIQSFLSSVGPWGNTPTAAALKTAHMTIGSGASIPDQIVPPKYVVLITDGAPNCGVGGVDSAMVTACVNEITAMTKDDVKTYVLGYHISGGAEADALDQMAAAGGTGDKAHRDIGDQKALEDQFRQIVGAARSCDFKLDAKVADPTYVSVKIDGSLQQLDKADGWKIANDMQSVTLQGNACETVRNGESHAISVQVECTPLY